jgi:hypothetical protein
MTKYLEFQPVPVDVDLVRGHIDNLGKRRVSVHARLEPAAWLLQQHAERTFFVVAPQDRKLNG